MGLNDDGSFLVGILVLIVILAIAWRLLFKGRQAERRLGVPVRRVVSADVGIDAPSSMLFSEEHRVKGAPDYVVDDRPSLMIWIGKILKRPTPLVYMPVEVKSASVRYRRLADVFQVLTSCFLLEEKGYMVNRGRLVYANAQFDIPYGPVQRQEVLRALEEIRGADQASLECFSAANDRRCSGCEFKTVCFK
jgi:CRISPR/Cas system-associated exonuclease Cas4 (RecB family)